MEFTSGYKKAITAFYATLTDDVQFDLDKEAILLLGTPLATRRDWKLEEHELVKRLKLYDLKLFSVTEKLEGNLKSLLNVMRDEHKTSMLAAFVELNRECYSSKKLRDVFDILNNNKEKIDETKSRLEKLICSIGEKTSSTDDILELVDMVTYHDYIKESILNTFKIAIPSRAEIVEQVVLALERVMVINTRQECRYVPLYKNKAKEYIKKLIREIRVLYMGLQQFYSKYSQLPPFDKNKIRYKLIPEHDVSKWMSSPCASTKFENIKELYPIKYSYSDKDVVDHLTAICMKLLEILKHNRFEVKEHLELIIEKIKITEDLSFNSIRELWSFLMLDEKLDQIDRYNNIKELWVEPIMRMTVLNTLLQLVTKSGILNKNKNRSIEFLESVVKFIGTTRKPKMQIVR